MLAMEILTNIIPKQILLRTCLISVPLLLFAAIAVYVQNSPADVLLERLTNAVGTTRESAAKNHSTPAAPPIIVPPPPSTGPVKPISDELLDGLLTTGFDEKSCISRYKSHLYRKPSPHKPSEHLVAKLRSYESLHRRCGPGTEPYKQTIVKLTESKNPINHFSDHQRSESDECKYIIWTPVNGLGNRMLSLVSTFLYAMLTDRVLLVELNQEMSGLFCQPFLNSTWESPTTFSWRRRRRDKPIPTFGDMLKKTNNYHIMTNNNTDKEDAAVPPVAFLTLRPKVKDQMRNFISDESQTLLLNVTVLVLMSDQYFVASLFLTPSFQQELDLLFPEKQAVFQHLGRYIFQPSNAAWGLITRFYRSYLSKANEKIGLQLRIFNPNTSPIKTVMDQLLACTLSNHLLPEIDITRRDVKQAAANKTATKAIFVATLFPDFSDKLRTMYWSKPTDTGEIVEVFQATHERVQRSRDSSHLVKAFTDIYLLSLCDVLVTSAKSTFGYVAQGLGGLKPWVLPRTTGNQIQRPPCVRGWSMDPCFHYPPAVNELIMRKCKDWRKGVNMVGGEDLAP